MDPLVTSIPSANLCKVLHNFVDICIKKQNFVSFTPVHHARRMHSKLKWLAWLGSFSEWGMTGNFFGLLLAYRWGSLVRVGISLVSLGLVGTWWLLAETAIKPIIVG